MRLLYQMYKYTKFVHEKNTYAENHRDSEGLIRYPDSKELYEEYAKLKSMPESKSAHLQNSCISNGYLRSSIGHIFVEDGKGAKLLDSFLFIPFGFLEELLSQYRYSLTLIFSATTVAVFIIFWHVLRRALQHFFPHIHW